MLGRLLKSYENSLVWISNTKVTKYIGNMYILFSSVTLFYKKIIVLSLVMQLLAISNAIILSTLCSVN